LEVLGKGLLALKDIQLGDYIKISHEQYEPVYSFGHHSQSQTGTFLQIHPSKLELTADHLIYLGGKGFVPASSVRVGDVLSTGQEVTGITKISQRGMYAPFTPSGTFLVDGVLVSSYISFQGSDVLRLGPFRTPIKYQWLAHLFEAPHRMWCRHLGSCKSERYSEEGISFWVAYPLHLANLAVNQHVVVIAMAAFALVPIWLGMFILEYLLVTKFLMASLGYLLWVATRFTTAKKSCRSMLGGSGRPNI